MTFLPIPYSTHTRQIATCKRTLKPDQFEGFLGAPLVAALWLMFNQSGQLR